jgi:hypothetical protein
MYNVNADDVASAIGLLLSAPVYFISDVPGVLDKEGKLIPSLNEAQLNSLIEDGTISGGMQVKVKSAVETAKFIGKPVYNIKTISFSIANQTEWYDVSLFNTYLLDFLSTLLYYESISYKVNLNLEVTETKDMYMGIGLKTYKIYEIET